MASHITRLYFHRTCLEPTKSLGTIQREVRQKIFAGMTFNFSHFGITFLGVENQAK